ncbi:MAG TPA: class I SAM-dependent methyltransferase [Tepidisphaeraceae bacterium]|jgi:cyclopropane fatty-acyl-phospholipid synthase-like methyltransferase
MSNSSIRNLSDAQAQSLRPGSEHYRAYVGPPQQYDLMGATQFSLLVTLGLREHHKLLDFGCGSLRAGRFFILYLARSNYHGLDINPWLVEDAVRNQLGNDLLAIKSPQFHYFDDFRADRCGTGFDFILAQSIFSHAGADIIEKSLRGFRAALAPDGLALATVIQPGSEVPDEFLGSGWVYPGCVAHSPATIQRLASAAGLHARAIPWLHPRQTWYIFSPNPARLPRPEEDIHLSGTILNEPSWQRSTT